MATIETRFSLGDRVWVISSGYLYPEGACRTCKGEKQITVGIDDFRCPRCAGKGVEPYPKHRWYVVMDSVVGQVRVEHTEDQPPRIHYMLHATGIGSGTLHRESALCTSEEEALAVCAKRNAPEYEPPDEEDYS